MYHRYPAFLASATSNRTFRAKNFADLLYTFPWATGYGGKWARSHATLGCHKVERERKKQLWPRAYHVPAVTGAHSKNVLGEKSAWAACAESVWRSAGSRPPVDATGTGVRGGPRLRTPSASRRLAIISLALLPHSFGRPSRLVWRRTPPMGGRDFPPLFRGRNMAVPNCRPLLTSTPSSHHLLWLLINITQQHSSLD